MSEGRAIIPEGYEQKPEDRVSRLHTNPRGGGGMKLSGTVKCTKSDCGRSIPFALRTNDSSKVEFTTMCKRCKTKIALTFLVAEWREEQTPYEVIEKGEITKEVKEENATIQPPTPAEVESGKSNEDSDKQSGDEQGETGLLSGEEERKPTQEDPFAGLE